MSDKILATNTVDVTDALNSVKRFHPNVVIAHKCVCGEVCEQVLDDIEYGSVYAYVRCECGEETELDYDLELKLELTVYKVPK